MASLSIAKSDAVSWRAWARLTLIGLWCGLCLIPYGLWRLLRLPSPWARLFFAGFARIAGVRTHLEGQPVRRDVLYVSNHISWLDIVTLGGRTDCAFIAKSEMTDWPIVGWFAKLNHTIFVSRGDRLSVEAQRAAAHQALQKGYPLTLFAEGTTGDGYALRRFHSSLFAAVTQDSDGSTLDDPTTQGAAPSVGGARAHRADAPAGPKTIAAPGLTIQPVALDYGRLAPVLAWPDEEGFCANALRVLSHRGWIDVTLHFLAPLDLTQGDRKVWSAQSRAAIVSALGQGQDGSR